MSFLDDLTVEQIEMAPFPLHDILNNSLYYPSCGLDGGVVKDCNTLNAGLGIVSFIYCDYGVDEEKLMGQINTFRGYRLFASRAVNPMDLIPNGWVPQYPPNFDFERYRQYEAHWQHFIQWFVYERCEEMRDNHGPKRFSLLYCGGEGVATYQALYWTNNACAKALAIIQPGHGFGLNWTNFFDADGKLAWVINNNPNGIPEVIYYGGGGGGYDDFGWEGYESVRMISPYYGSVGNQCGMVNVLSYRNAGLV